MCVCVRVWFECVVNAKALCMRGVSVCVCVCVRVWFECVVNAKALCMRGVSVCVCVCACGLSAW